MEVNRRGCHACGYRPTAGAGGARERERLPHWCCARCGCASNFAIKRACHRCGLDKPSPPGAMAEGKSFISQQAAAGKGAGMAAEVKKEKQNAWSPNKGPPARPTLADWVAAEQAKLAGVAAASPADVAVAAGCGNPSHDPASEQVTEGLKAKLASLEAVVK